MHGLSFVFLMYQVYAFIIRRKEEEEEEVFLLVQYKLMKRD